jgi:hypothetical protein
MELLSLYLERVIIRYAATDNKTRMSATIGWVQKDHHNKEAREPVVVAPRLVDNLQPALVLSAMKDNLRSKKKIDTYEFVAIALQELDIRLDEVLLNDCWVFFLEYVRKFDLRKQVVTQLSVCYHGTSPWNIRDDNNKKRTVIKARTIMY